MTNNVTQPKYRFGELFREVIRLSKHVEQHSSRFYQVSIAEKIFRLQIPDPSIAGIIISPLEHVRVSDNVTPDFTITVWDSQSTSMALPDFLGQMYRKPATSNLGPLDGETIFYKDSDKAIAFQTPRKHLSMADFSNRKAVFWIPDISHLFPLDGRPLRTIFQWFLDSGNHQIVHAAGAGIEKGGVIITGLSGAGKSTVAAACINSPLAIAGDENVILSTHGSPMVFSLYNSTNLDPKSISLLSFFRKLQIQPKESRIDKALFYLYESFPDKIINQFPLKAVVVSKVTGHGDAQLEPLNPAAALTALAPTSLFQVPGNKQEAFFRMSRIVKQIPCYLLSVGESLEDVPALLYDLINKTIMGDKR